MKLYWIEYYDKITEFTTIYGFSESDDREQFRYRIVADKIIVSVEAV